MDIGLLVLDAYRNNIPYSDVFKDIRPEELASALGEIQGLPDNIRIPFIGFLAEHEDYRFRVLAAQEIGKSGTASCNHRLMDLLSDRRAEVRRAAVHAAGSLNDSSWFPILKKLANDSDNSVRQTANINTLKVLINRPVRSSAHNMEILKRGLNLMRENEAEAAVPGLVAVRGLRGTNLEALAAAAVAGTKRFHPGLYYEGTPRTRQLVGRGVSFPPSGGPDSGWGAPDFSPIGSGGEMRRALAAPDPRFHPFVDHLAGRANAAVPTDDKPVARYLYGGFTGLFSGDEFKPGKPPPALSFQPDHRAVYRFSVAITPADQKIRGLELLDTEGQQFPETENPIELQVALLVDDRLLKVEDEEVKTLVLPAGSKGSDPVHFKVRTLNVGDTFIEVLIYLKGCLVMRGKSKTFGIEDVECQVSPFPDSPTAADTLVGPSLSYHEDIQTIARDVKKERLMNLLIDDNHGGDERLFALFYNDETGYHLDTARVRRGNAEWDYGDVRKRLEALVNLRGSNLLSKSFDLAVPDIIVPRVLDALQDAGNRIFSSLFSDGKTSAIRAKMDKLLKEAEGGIFQVVSDDVFAPWQMMYTGDPSLPAEILRFVGMKHQVEQKRGTGAGLRWNSEAGGDGRPKPMVGFINKDDFPQKTVSYHDGRFPPSNSAKDGPCGMYREEDVLAEMAKRGLDRAGMYFYCQGNFNREDKTDTWIKITSGEKITLADLESKTAFDYETYTQSVFRYGPLVFLNVCKGGQTGSSMYGSMVGFLLENKKAGCVIAPETFIPAYFGTDFAEQFYTRMDDESLPVGQILLDLRKHYWDEYKNPLGLLYNLYSNAEYKPPVCQGGDAHS